MGTPQDLFDIGQHSAPIANALGYWRSGQMIWDEALTYCLSYFRGECERLAIKCSEGDKNFLSPLVVEHLRMVPPDSVDSPLIWQAMMIDRILFAGRYHNDLLTNKAKTSVPDAIQVRQEFYDEFMQRRRNRRNDL